MHEFHTYDRLPLSTQGKVLEIEEFSQTEKTRRQFRHLAHLPLTSKFQLVDIGIDFMVEEFVDGH